MADRLQLNAWSSPHSSDSELLVSHVPASEVVDSLFSSLESLVESLLEVLVKSLLSLSFFFSLLTAPLEVLFAFCFASGPLGYKALTAALRLSHKYRDLESRSLRSPSMVLAVRSVRSGRSVRSVCSIFSVRSVSMVLEVRVLREYPLVRRTVSDRGFISGRSCSKLSIDR